MPPFHHSILEIFGRHLAITRWRGLVCQCDGKVGPTSLLTPTRFDFLCAVGSCLPLLCLVLTKSKQPYFLAHILIKGTFLTCHTRRLGCGTTDLLFHFACSNQQLLVHLPAQMQSSMRCAPFHCCGQVILQPCKMNYVKLQILYSIFLHAKHRILQTQKFYWKI